MFKIAHLNDICCKGQLTPLAQVKLKLTVRVGGAQVETSEHLNILR